MKRFFMKLRIKYLRKKGLSWVEVLNKYGYKQG